MNNLIESINKITNDINNLKDVLHEAEHKNGIRLSFKQKTKLRTDIAVLRNKLAEAKSTYLKNKFSDSKYLKVIYSRQKQKNTYFLEVIDISLKNNLLFFECTRRLQSILYENTSGVLDFYYDCVSSFDLSEQTKNRTKLSIEDLENDVKEITEEEFNAMYNKTLEIFKSYE